VIYCLSMGDGVECYPGLVTLRAWARSGNVTPDTPLVDVRTGERVRAGDLTVLEGFFAPAPAPPSTPQTADGARRPLRWGRSLPRPLGVSHLVIPPRWAPPVAHPTPVRG
jgi:hypothetical protein